MNWNEKEKQQTQQQMKWGTQFYFSQNEELGSFNFVELFPPFFNFFLFLLSSFSSFSSFLPLPLFLPLSLFFFSKRMSRFDLSRFFYVQNNPKRDQYLRYFKKSTGFDCAERLVISDFTDLVMVERWNWLMNRHVRLSPQELLSPLLNDVS